MFGGFVCSFGYLYAFVVFCMFCLVSLLDFFYCRIFILASCLALLTMIPQPYRSQRVHSRISSLRDSWINAPALSHGAVVNSSWSSDIRTCCHEYHFDESIVRD